MKNLRTHLLYATILALTSESFLSTSFSTGLLNQYGVAFFRPHSCAILSVKLRSCAITTRTTNSHRFELSSTNDDNSYMSSNQQQDEEGGDGDKVQRVDLLLSSMERISQYGPIRLILASQSPRRREILDMMGLRGRYHVQPSPLDETALQIQLAENSKEEGGILPKRYTNILAESKARALVESDQLKLASMVTDNDDSAAPSGSSGSSSKASETSMKQITTFVLGSDTIVDLDGTILEKPNSKAHAVEMLHKLSGSWNEVHTGVSIYRVDYIIDTTNATSNASIRSELVSSFVDTTRVKFGTLGEEDIRAYVETGEPMDKAGSYGIQGMGGQLVERIEGDFFTVMGLPMHRLSKELAKALSNTP